MAALASSASASSGERWPPLESSPDVFNQLMWSLGVPEDEAEFHDVYGFDADALEMVPQTVIAVIFCFPDPPQNASNPSEQVLATEEKETWDEVYFIKQIESLGNACGTIALLHAVGNTFSEISLCKFALYFCPSGLQFFRLLKSLGGQLILLENSCLDMFFKSTASMDPYKRAIFLEKNNDMARAHSLAAHAGDTELCDIVEEHYICFMALNGTLYELDGMKHEPIKHGSSSAKSLLQDAVRIIKAIMHDIPNSINFNVMVLSRKAK